MTHFADKAFEIVKKQIFLSFTVHVALSTFYILSKLRQYWSEIYVIFNFTITAVDDIFYLNIYLTSNTKRYLVANQAELVI